MRKLLLLALSAGLFVACATGTTNETENATATEGENTKTELTIAYVDMDSLIQKFDMYHDLRTKYETKAKKTEDNLTSKGRSLEREVVSFQEKIQKGLVTRSQAATMEQNLQKKQQDFMQSRDASLQELAEEEQVMLNQIQNAIAEFIAEYNAGYKYSMILTTAGSSPVLSADPELNITNEVVDGLNQKYIATKDTE